MFGVLLGADSFNSSDPDERDLYIEETFEIDDNDNWIANGHGVYLIGRGISSIEFLRVQSTTRTRMNKSPQIGPNRRDIVTRGYRPKPLTNRSTRPKPPNQGSSIKAADVRKR